MGALYQTVLSAMTNTKIYLLFLFEYLLISQDSPEYPDEQLHLEVKPLYKLIQVPPFWHRDGLLHSDDAM